MFKVAKFVTVVAILSSAIAGAVAAPAAASAQDAPDDRQPYRASLETRHGQRVYCIIQEVSGSRLPVKTCLTQVQWAERGAQIRHIEMEASCPPKGDHS